MDPAAARRAATGVGLVTLVIGGALVAVPDRLSRLLRVGDHDEALRIIGALDVALVPGLVAGRPRWRWVAARVGLNLGIAAYCLRLMCREGTVGAKAGVVAMTVATAADSRMLVALRRAG